MFNEFVVKVYRYWGDESGAQSWNGWFFSKVYAIEGDRFLVYDDGMLDAYNGEDDFCENGFVWVDFTEAIPKCNGKGYEMRVQPYTADTPQTKQSDSEYYLELADAVMRGEMSDAGANQAWYEYINHKDEPQTDCHWK